ncbi:MAG: hypothetical protein SF069_18570 [Phycisphaerae bacterium]|nr:hypothetical protein [Phycisphaerae bacterium]
MKGISRHPSTHTRVRIFTSACVAALALAAAPSAMAQCEVIVKESFRLGSRLHGGNGRMRDAEIGDTLNDYWLQVPEDGTRWICGDNGVPRWSFAATSDDPAEFDPLDPTNGTAWPDATAAAFVPFTQPTSAFVTSIDVVFFLSETTTGYFGFSTSSQLTNNFMTHGALWMSLNGLGQYTIYQNGAEIVATGTADLAGILNSGWIHVDFTYDPVTQTVSAVAGETQIAATKVDLARPLTFFGIEAATPGVNFNNLIIATGDLLAASAPASVSVCEGGTVQINAETNAAQPATMRWTHRLRGELIDGPQPGGSIVSGAFTPNLTIQNVGPDDAANYWFTVANECGVRASAYTALQLCSRTIGDMNCDGVVSVGDISGFVLALSDPAGYPIAYPTCDISLGDINADGFVTVGDISAFVALITGG